MSEETGTVLLIDDDSSVRRTHAKMLERGGFKVEPSPSARHALGLVERGLRASVIVTDLKIFTTGGVITPGMAIMDVVPEGDDLVVEAMVDPRDIDGVAPGLPAQVRLTAYKQRLVPTLDGEVVTVSRSCATGARRKPSTDSG